MKFYIATGLPNASAHNLVRDLLIEAGHEITYDWTVHGSVWEKGTKVIQQVAHAETQGVMLADFVVVLLPGWRGTHAELGMAIAAWKPVVLWAQDQRIYGAVPDTCAFYHHDLVFLLPGQDPHMIPFMAERWVKKVLEGEHRRARIVEEVEPLIKVRQL